VTAHAKERVFAVSSISLLSVVAVLAVAVAVAPLVLLRGFVYSALTPPLAPPITPPVAIAIAIGCAVIAAACVFIIWQIARDTDQPDSN
jgi:hypothetical protein